VTKTYYFAIFFELRSKHEKNAGKTPAKPVAFPNDERDV